MLNVTPAGFVAALNRTARTSAVLAAGHVHFEQTELVEKDGVTCCEFRVADANISGLKVDIYGFIEPREVRLISASSVGPGLLAWAIVMATLAPQCSFRQCAIAAAKLIEQPLDREPNIKVGLVNYRVRGYEGIGLVLIASAE